MELVEDLGAEVNRYMSTFTLFCNIGKGYCYTFNHCFSYFNSFKNQVYSNDV